MSRVNELGCIVKVVDEDLVLKLLLKLLVMFEIWIWFWFWFGLDLVCFGLEL